MNFQVRWFQEVVQSGPGSGGKVGWDTMNDCRGGMNDVASTKMLQRSVGENG